MSTNELTSLFGSLYGAIFLGTVMSTAFYGVTCMQTFFYYVHYPNDPLHIKISIAVMWALNTVHEALSISGAYKYIITGLVNPLSFSGGILDLVLTYPLTAVVAVPTQGFFVYRIYVFSGKSLIAPLIWFVLAIVQLVDGFLYAGKALYSANGTVQVISVGRLNSGLFAILDTLSLSVAAGIDVLIAIFMTYLLFRERAATGFASTAHILQRLALFSVNTGIWTATFALLAIILLRAFPNTVIYSVFGVQLCPLYCNTLLANINGRSYIRGETTHNIGMDLLSNSRPRTSDDANGDKRRGQTDLISTHETIVTFPDANRSISAAKEHV